MLVQYLVGLCALKWDANEVGIDVMIGDMVLDESTGRRRDVDVTVTVDTKGGEKYAFKGYEVKHESGPLDVSDVEGLATKLNDMPSVTHRAIVSTSGYTAPALKKASYHGIDLFTIQEWTKPLEEQFPHLAPMKGPPEDTIRGVYGVLVWINEAIWLGTSAPKFEIPWAETIFDADGNEHALYADFRRLTDAMIVRSTRILWALEPNRVRVDPLLEAAQSDDPDVQIPEPKWSYAHTLDVAGDEVYVKVEGKLYRVDNCTIHGDLAWELRPLEYYVMEKVPSGEPFAGALIAQSGIPGDMEAVIFSGKDRSFQTRSVQLNEKQQNRIHKLKIASQ